MDGDSLGMILALAILILLSAYFSATETAFSSFNKIRMKNMAADGNQRAKLVLRLADQYDKILSTILIGNNIVNITSASLATVIFVEHYGDFGVTLSTVIMTVLVLIFGEISPKSLAKEAPERFAMFSAPILRFFTMLLTPLNFLFMQWKKLLSKLFKTSPDPGITEEELITIVEEATQVGGLNAQEGELIRSAIEFNDLEASDILTPRIDIVAVARTQTRQEVRELFLSSGYSRLPVYEGSIDHIVGVLNFKDFCGEPDATVQELVKPVTFTTYAVKISKLLRLLQNTKSHLAVVTDEYGGTQGILTLEDILEELVGEIWDEQDEVVEDFEQLSENEYRVSCAANLDKLFRLLGVDAEYDVATVSGWVIEQLGRIPNEGDSFDFENLHIAVTRTDFQRVLEIHVIVAPVCVQA